ncbi:hypothetical protein DNTS_009404 [Danionella cerebrum]|uniref:Inhibitor of growth protein N-terminal histone-binding domain-containing protein n=1 Tax=Danionella cerebrum TaxID=2873325 RepID=A0A553R215_9TELE|nr:hypothetical protein DNTS_009404 [Danionella translucida]
MYQPLRYSVLVSYEPESKAMTRERVLLMVREPMQPMVSQRGPVREQGTRATLSADILSFSLKHTHTCTLLFFFPPSLTLPSCLWKAVCESVRVSPRSPRHPPSLPRLLFAWLHPPQYSGIENLPFELQRNFQLMRDLDQRTEDLKGQIDSLAREYTSNARTLSSEQKLSLLRQIQQSYGKCKEFGDDKVQLAMQTYEMIESTDYDSTSSKGNKSDIRGPKKKEVNRSKSKVKSSDDDCSSKSGQKKVKLTQGSEFSTPAANFGNVHPSDVLDMPVDPNEPTYCLCHQVSYGEMIGCDNTDVLPKMFTGAEEEVNVTRKEMIKRAIEAGTGVAPSSLDTNVDPLLLYPVLVFLFSIFTSLSQPGGMTTGEDEKKETSKYKKIAAQRDQVILIHIQLVLSRSSVVSVSHAQVVH